MWLEKHVFPQMVVNHGEFHPMDSHENKSPRKKINPGNNPRHPGEYLLPWEPTFPSFLGVMTFIFGV